MLPILTGVHVFGCSLRERMARVALSAKRTYGLDLPGVDSAPAGVVDAEVNHNRWIVECPDCHSAEYLWPEEPVFFCTNCYNAAVGGRPRAVRVPTWRGTIERVLRARPVPQNRNWQPGESVGVLRAQNRAHGLPEEVA